MKYKSLVCFAPEDANEGFVAPISDETINEEVEIDNETDYAEADEPNEVEEVEEVEETKPVQSAEENAKYAAARREAEAREKAVREELNRLNNIVAERFGEYENPITHEKVTGVESYFNALEAQRQTSLQNEMQAKGIDPNIINELVNNNPVIRQAQEVLARQQQEEHERVVRSEIEQIHSLDASINNADDLLNMENFEEFKNYVNRGYSFIDSFKLANFAKLQHKQNEAVKQAVINQAKSTSHLESTNGLSAGGDELKEIPTAELAMWRECYPGLSMKELKEKYNKALKF